MNISDLQLRSYQNAKAKGFHSNPDGTEKDHFNPVRIGSRLALIHSELSEALEALSRGQMQLWYGEDGKPEGFGIELADALIRTCDLAETLEISLSEPTERWYPKTNLEDNPESLADFLTNVHSWLSTAHCYRDGHVHEIGSALNQVVNGLFYLTRFLGIDLWSMVEIKHSYNLTRPLRHGGKRL